MNLSLTKTGLLAGIFLLRLCAVDAQVHTFSYTGGSQSWTVPPTVTSIAVDVVGATGGVGESVLYGTTYFYNAGGNGGRVQCTLAVTPGTVLQIYVGGMGDSFATAHGGFNGGGSGLFSGWGGGGGGASDIRISPFSLNERVVVAGGGGGGGGLVCPGGVDVLRGGGGGGILGGKGLGCYSTSEGKGGTDTAGGEGGYNGTVYAPAGRLDTGGNGAPGYYGSAGGGGGYYGGGGSINAGAGGGSSMADATRASGIVHTADYNDAGDGKVTITEMPLVGVNTVEPDDISLFPNPATNVIIVNTGMSVYTTCNITNTLGQVVMHTDIVSTQTKLALNELPGGIYYLSLRGEHATKVLRFIKE